MFLLLLETSTRQGTYIFTQGRSSHPRLTAVEHILLQHDTGTKLSILVTRICFLKSKSYISISLKNQSFILTFPQISVTKKTKWWANTLPVYESNHPATNKSASTHKRSQRESPEFHRTPTTQWPWYAQPRSARVRAVTWVANHRNRTNQGQGWWIGWQAQENGYRWHREDWDCQRASPLCQRQVQWAPDRLCNPIRSYRIASPLLWSKPLLDSLGKDSQDQKIDLSWRNRTPSSHIQSNIRFLLLARVLCPCHVSLAWWISPVEKSLLSE